MRTATKKLQTCEVWDRCCVTTQTAAYSSDKHSGIHRGFPGYSPTLKIKKIKKSCFCVSCGTSQVPQTQHRGYFVKLHLLLLLLSVSQSTTHLSCPRRRGSAVLGSTTGGRCCHCTPHGRSGSQSHPLSPSYSEPEGTDRWCLRHDTWEENVWEKMRMCREEERERRRGRWSEADGAFLIAWFARLLG